MLLKYDINSNSYVFNSCQTHTVGAIVQQQQESRILLLLLTHFQNIFQLQLMLPICQMTDFLHYLTSDYLRNSVAQSDDRMAKKEQKLNT